MAAPILIVEDDLTIAAALQEALVNAGWVVAGVARTYDEVIWYAEHTSIALAIVDVNLANNTDGITAARALQRHSKAILIYLTGTTDDVTFERAKATRPAAFLNKPLRVREVLQQVELALANKPLPDIKLSDGPVYIPTDYGFVRVDQTSIYYLEAARSYTTLYLNSNTLTRLNLARKPDEPLILTGNLKYWERHLSPSLFYRLSRSLLVNLTKIDLIGEQQVQIGVHTLSLPAGTRKGLLEKLDVIRTR